MPIIIVDGVPFEGLDGWSELLSGQSAFIIDIIRKLILIEAGNLFFSSLGI